jgi:hypothetical protein
MVSIEIIMISNLIEHAKCGASRSGKTTCSNASTLVPRKETKGNYFFFFLVIFDPSIPIFILNYGQN